MSTKAADFPRTFDGTAYGHGLFLDERYAAKVAHHGGLNTGFSAQILLVPERRLGLVFLMNRDGIRFTRAAQAALLPLAGLSPPIDTALPDGQPVGEHDARALAGRYRNRWTVELFVEGGTLRLRRDNATAEVRYIGGDRYVARDYSSLEHEVRVGRTPEGTPFLRQFLWAFAREFVPPGEASP
jgi:hypothetical protein